MKPPRFLLSQNKLAKTKDQFIVHTRSPAFLARVVEPAVPTDQPHALIKRGGLVELVRLFEETDDEILLTILKQMADWYNYGQGKK